MAEMWEEALWSYLDKLNLEESIIQAGELIVYINGELLPAMANYRRQRVLTAVRVQGIKPGILADRIGARASTVRRLVTEAQADSRAA